MEDGKKLERYREKYFEIVIVVATEIVYYMFVLETN